MTRRRAHSSRALSLQSHSLAIRHALCHPITMKTVSQNTDSVPINIIFPPHVLCLVSSHPILPHKVLALYIMVFTIHGIFFRNAATTNVGLLHSEFILRAEEHRAKSRVSLLAQYGHKPRILTTISLFFF